MKQFPPFRLDTVNQCLWRRKHGGPDERLLLKPTAFAILHYLVTHAGRLVTKDELRAAVWPDTSVKPDVLKRHILDIRVALGDHPTLPPLTVNFQYGQLLRIIENVDSASSL